MCKAAFSCGETLTFLRINECARRLSHINIEGIRQHMKKSVYKPASSYAVFWFSWDEKG